MKREKKRIAKLTWAAMVKIEPELELTLKNVRSIKDDKSKPAFCANARWYGYGYPSLKKRTSRLASTPAAKSCEQWKPTI
jgi:hypothetical protein